MITNEIYAHVRPAVALIIQDLNETPDAATLEERVYARLWTYVTHAVRDLDPASIEREPPKRDGRSKAWQYVVRFWHVTAISEDLIAETDPEIMQGTGALAAIIPQYGIDMHAAEDEDDPVIRAKALPPELSADSIKDKLAQLRNNLGRQGSAVLRIPYDVGEESYRCQVGVTRPGE